MGQIAEKFSVSLDTLLAANPGIDPNSMSVGKTLLIPSSPQNPTGASSPTPAPFSIEQVACHPGTDGALWCFALAHNELPDPIEDVTAQVTILDSKGETVASQVALLPLDILPAGASMPLSVFFQPGLPGDIHPQVQVLTAIRLLPHDPRYLDAAVQDTQVQVDWSGLSAQVSGNIHLSSSSKPANRIWLVASVFDDAGNVIGVRRWETTESLQPGGDIPFSFQVAAVSGEIARVVFAVEARP